MWLTFAIFFATSFLFLFEKTASLPLPLMDPACRGSQAYRELLCDLVSHELSNDKSNVTPALAAVLADDSDDGIALTHHSEELVSSAVKNMMGGKV